jgi:glycine/D-amino acid oxidase-like deaminating enzyme/nitrite reductase/ring-hydroxylating ferredoxin subunit
MPRSVDSDPRARLNRQSGAHGGPAYHVHLAHNLMKSTQSLWSRAPSIRRFPGLETDQHAEVAVVGGGITGLTTALLLARAGKRVTLLETRTLAAGVSGSTTAHLTEALDTRYHELESSFGADGAALARASSREAIEKIAELSRGSDCGFERLDGYLFTDDESQLSSLDAELLAAERAGAQVTRLNEAPLPLRVRGAIKFANQAQFRPTDYLRGLAEQLAATNAQICEGVTVLNVETEGQLRLETDTGYRVTADAIVLATHAPFQNLKLQVELAQYRSYVVAGAISGPLGGLFWDMADPYHYYRSVALEGQNYLIVGGGDHRTGTIPEGGPEAPFSELGALAAQLGTAVSERWSAQVAEPSDGLPFIGKPDSKTELYLAQGFSGNGMTFGTLSAMLISDSLLGRQNAYAELYRADRFKPLASAAAVITENAETAAHLVAGHIKPVSDKPIDQLRCGEGCIVKSDGKKLAVYRDADGAVHAVSAICTHQGCQVAFNPVEHSWDCPCHGSRFDINGRVLDGPAKKPLEKHHL